MIHRLFLVIVALWFPVALLFPGALWFPGSVSAENREAGESQKDWPRFLGRNYDGAVAHPSSKIDWTSDPRFVWSIAVGEGYGIGTVAGNRFFQLDASGSPFAGGTRERLRCFDLESGKEIWSQSNAFQYSDMLGYEAGPRSSPTVVSDRLVTLGVTGMLRCRNVRDGEQIWAVDTNTEYGVVQNFFGVGCSPMVLGDQVIVMVGGSPPEDQEIAPMRLNRVAPNGSAVVAFDLNTGKELWKCGDDLASYSSPRPIEIDGKIFVLVFARTGLMLVDPDQGEVCWQFEHRADMLESVNAIVPVVDDRMVFLSECYEVGSAVLKVDAKSFQVVWQDTPRDRRNQSMRSHWSTPVLVDGFLYGCSGRNSPDSDLRCIEMKTGEVQWSDSRRIRSAVTRVGDHIVVLEERGTVQVIKANPSKLDVVAEWNLQEAGGDRPAIAYPCWAAPLVVGTKLIVRGTNRVVCLDLGGS